MSGLLVAFPGPEELLEAARRLTAEGFTQMDAFTPFAIPELPEALGRRPTRLPWLIFLGGLSGAATGYGMQYYASVLGFPLNVGGRPWHSYPSFMPVTFELTVLFASFAAFFGMLAVNGLPRLHHPVFDVADMAQASQDRFLLYVESADPHYDHVSTRLLLEDLPHGRGVYEVG